jgi:hypothetical protein
VVSMLTSGIQDRGFEFSGEYFFEGKVNPSVPCQRFGHVKESCYLRGTRNHRPNSPTISRPIPTFTNRGLSYHLTWSASGDDGRN